MSAVTPTQVNELLVAIGRSLLQYTADAYPWSPANKDLHEPILRLAHQQQNSIRKIVHWLDDEGETLDYGTYPVDYTSLHYVSAAFLLKYMISNQSAIVELATVECSEEDAETAHHLFLAEILANEQSILDELKKL
jgi:hypothetical protein